MWKWGPVTQYQVSLEGIDSIGDSDNDVMNLVARYDAADDTRSMLGEGEISDPTPPHSTIGEAAHLEEALADW